MSRGGRAAGGGGYDAANESSTIFLVDTNTVWYVQCTQFHTPKGYEDTKKCCLWTGPLVPVYRQLRYPSFGLQYHTSIILFTGGKNKSEFHRPYVQVSIVLIYLHYLTKDFAEKGTSQCEPIRRILWHGYVIFSHPLDAPSSSWNG